MTKYCGCKAKQSHIWPDSSSKDRISLLIIRHKSVKLCNPTLGTLQQGLQPAVMLQV